MKEFEKHLITDRSTIREVLSQLDMLASDAILFLIDDHHKLEGSLTDGDIRRGLIKGLTLENNVRDFVQKSPKYFTLGSVDLTLMKHWRESNYKIIPVVNANFEVVDVVNFRNQRSYLPLDAVIMAGGKGSRLMPLTENTPKPLLKVGNKPIVEHNIDRLKSYGIKNVTLSVKYLGGQLISYFGNGDSKDLVIRYVEEEQPLGTIGAVGKVDVLDNDYILVMNSDLLTNINFEEMFATMINKNADMIVATIPYEVEIPYGVVETEGDLIVSLKEKPTYTYYSNAGIYIFKKEHKERIPLNEYYNATDLMEELYNTGSRVIQFPILDYWLDIGKHHDYEKAQKDIAHITL